MAKALTKEQIVAITRTATHSLIRSTSQETGASPISMGILVFRCLTADLASLHKGATGAYLKALAAWSEASNAADRKKAEKAITAAERRLHKAAALMTNLESAEPSGRG